MATKAGTVTAVTQEAITVEGTVYPLKAEPATSVTDQKTLILPRFRSWHEPAVAVEDKVAKKQLVARGVTHVFFQANMWVFSGIVLLAGIAMGLGMAAVYKHIPDYFPNDVGVVGGLVGVLGGLGGFALPIVFGYLLKWTGLWTTCWLLLAVLSFICLYWMHRVVMKISKRTFERD